MDANQLVESIRVNAPSFKRGDDTYYIVEQDLKIHERDLLRYAQQIVDLHDPATQNAPSLERLVGATVDDKLMRWELPVELTWSIDKSTFIGLSDELEKARQICTQATEDWNLAAAEMGISDQVQFTENDDDPVFTFVYETFDDPRLYAVAFFPNDPIDMRVVNIGPKTFETPNDFDPVGVIRHELGHVLGFRHEHIRTGAQQGMSAEDKSKMEQWVTGGIGAQILTDYDSQSVMHYPLNNRGTLDFKLSADDKAGFKALYTMPVDEVREYPT